MTTNDSKKRSKGGPLPIIGTLLVAGGAVLLGLVGWTYLDPAPPPYSYELVAEGGPDEFASLGLDDLSDLSISKYEVRTEGFAQPVAVLHLGEPPSGDPVLLDWQNKTTEPVLTLLPPFAETKILAEKITEHLPAGAPILGWWDTSRRLRLLTDTEALLDENLGQPLLIPTAWQGKAEAVEAIERAFWQLPPTADAQETFDHYVDALLLDKAAGVAKLREMAGDGDAYVVVHLLDAYKLSALEPDRFGVGFKDFPGGSQLHSMTRLVKDWLKEQGYQSYTVALDEGSDATRVFFLTEPTHANTLMAQLLPFNTSAPFAIEGMPLVYQHGGYWVFRLAEEGAES